MLKLKAHTSGIHKAGQRARLVEAYRLTHDSPTLRKGEFFFTLGGECGDGCGNILPGSEYAQLRRSGFLTSTQYVSVERDPVVWERNMSIKGPIWLQGDVKSEVYSHGGIYNLDLMMGVWPALNMGIPQAVLAVAPVGSILHFNFTAYHSRKANQGYKYPVDTEETFRRDRRMQPWVRHLALLDTQEYWSTPCTLMCSMIFERVAV